MAIENFRDEYYFLSTMYPVKEKFEAGEGIVVASVEVPYQVAKFEDMDIRRRILAASDGYEAKKMANRLEKLSVPKRSDWDEIKVDVMSDLNWRKFSQVPRLKELLIATGAEEIIEGNMRGDNFWGVSPPGNPDGENWLGQILMGVRHRLKVNSVH